MSILLFTGTQLEVSLRLTYAATPTVSNPNAAVFVFFPRDPAVSGIAEENNTMGMIERNKDPVKLAT